MVGAANASSIFSGGIYLISAGSSDFLQNYYINPLLNNAYTIDQFFNILFENFAKFVEVYAIQNLKHKFLSGLIVCISCISFKPYETASLIRI